MSIVYANHAKTFSRYLVVSLGASYPTRRFFFSNKKFATRRFYFLQLFSVVLVRWWRGGGGGGALPIIDYTPERGTFFRLAVYETVGIARVEVHKRVGKTDIQVLKGSFKISRTNAPNCLVVQVFKVYSTEKFNKSRS